METKVVTTSDPIRTEILQHAAALLRAGELVAFPTETVYGLGASLDSPAGIERIFAVKERPTDNPLIVHVSDLAMARQVVRTIPPLAQALVDAFWPGPLSLVLPRGAGIPDNVTAGLDTVVVRCPCHPVAQALIATLGSPVVAPSANRSGRISPTTAEHVWADLSGRIPLILDAGPVTLGIESTVLDCTTATPNVLRPGSITREALEAVTGDTVTATQDGLGRSPGMKYRHYSPSAVLVLLRPNQPLAAALTALDLSPTATAFVSHSQTTESAVGYSHVLPNDPAAAAPQLYAALRSADRPDITHIVVEGWEKAGVGEAMMNRLEKAATHIV